MLISGETNEAGQPHGTGVFQYGSGDIYSGQFCNNQFHGDGLMKYSSGDVYEG